VLLWRGTPQAEDAGADYELQLRVAKKVGDSRVCTRTDGEWSEPVALRPDFDLAYMGIDPGIIVGCDGLAVRCEARVRMVSRNQEPGPFSESVQFDATSIDRTISGADVADG